MQYPQNGDASNSSHSLEGRPAPQTTFSETGGALAFAPDSDDDQHDYVPSDDDAPALARSTRSRRDTSSSKAGSSTASNQLLAGWTTSELHYLTRKTSQQLKLLSPAASFLLYKTLVEQAPQHLTKTVISSFFLPPVLGSS